MRFLFALCAFLTLALPAAAQSPGMLPLGGGSGPGVATAGISQATADGRYLKLAADNDPLTGTLQLALGTAALPGLSFAARTDDGFYSVAANDLGWATAGFLRMDLSTSALTLTVPALLAAGSAAAPSFSFSSDANSGVYSVGADDVGIATNGTLRLDVSTTNVTSTLGYTSANGGTAAAPAFRVGGMGLYSSVSGLGLSANSTNIVDASDTQWNFGASVANIVATGNFTNIGNGNVLTKGLFAGTASSAQAAVVINTPSGSTASDSAMTIGHQGAGSSGRRFVNFFTACESSTSCTGSGVDAGKITYTATTNGEGIVIDAANTTTGYMQIGNSRNPWRGTAPAAFPTCNSLGAGRVIYKEDTDTAGTNSQLCLCARDNGALTYGWQAIGGALTGTCT